MKKCDLLLLVLFITFTIIVCPTNLVFAQGQVNVDGGPLKEAEWNVKVGGAELSEDHSGVDTWITKWYGPAGNYTNNGGFAASATTDLIELGTDGKLTQLSLSTVVGLNKTKSVDIVWPDANGGAQEWSVFEIDPANPHNMDRGGPVDNYDLYAICVIDAPKAMKSVMSPAHDDHAQIWINGEKWYNNPTWTGAAQQVDFNIEVDLKKGANVVLFRCGEGGGHGYLNLHFDDDTHDVVDIYPDKADDQASFLKEIAGVLPVEPTGKLTTIWADIKRK